MHNERNILYLRHWEIKTRNGGVKKPCMNEDVYSYGSFFSLLLLFTSWRSLLSHPWQSWSPGWRFGPELKNSYSSCRELVFRFQQPCQTVCNCLYLHLQKIWCFLLNCLGSCTYGWTHTHTKTHMKHIKVQTNLWKNVGFQRDSQITPLNYEGCWS